ncbi:hypothetical protein BJX76DRAFT_323010 [Aspergillus varians]
MLLARGLYFEPLLSSFLQTPGILRELAAVKLKREASSQEPSLRRYLGHHGVLKRCMTAAEEDTAQPAALRDDPPKSRHASEIRPVRAQLTSAIKGIVYRNPPSVPLPGNQELSHVQARGTTKPNNRASSYGATPRVFLVLNPFVRLKKKMYDKHVA